MQRSKGDSAPGVFLPARGTGFTLFLQRNQWSAGIFGKPFPSMGEGRVGVNDAVLSKRRHQRCAIADHTIREPGGLSASEIAPPPQPAPIKGVGARWRSV